MRERTPDDLVAAMSSRLGAVARWLTVLGTTEGAQAVCTSLDGLITDAQTLRGLAETFRSLDVAAEESEAFDAVMSHLDPHAAAVAAVHEEIEQRKGGAR